MRRFLEYVRDREEKRGHTNQSGPHRDTTKTVGDPMSELFSIIQRAWHEHNEETLHFLERLAKRDDSIRDSLNRLRDGDGRGVPQGGSDQYSDDDEIRPPDADKASGEDNPMGD